MRLLLVALMVVLLVGFHLVPAWIGTLVMLGLLVVSGLGVRLLKLLGAGLLFLVGTGA
jgi:hypothetical protein